MRFARPLLGVAAAVLLAGGAVASEPGGSPAPEPAVWDDGVRPEPSALDARVGAGCAPDPSVAADQLVGSAGTAAAGIDAVCTWGAPDADGGAVRTALQ